MQFQRTVLLEILMIFRHVVVLKYHNLFKKNKLFNWLDHVICSSFDISFQSLDSFVAYFNKFREILGKNKTTNCWIIITLFFDKAFAKLIHEFLEFWYAFRGGNSNARTFTPAFQIGILSDILNIFFHKISKYIFYETICLLSEILIHCSLEQCWALTVCNQQCFWHSSTFQRAVNSSLVVSNYHILLDHFLNTSVPILIFTHNFCEIHFIFLFFSNNVWRTTILFKMFV